MIDYVCAKEAIINKANSSFMFIFINNKILYLWSRFLLENQNRNKNYSHFWCLRGGMVEMKVGFMLESFGY